MGITRRVNIVELAMPPIIGAAIRSMTSAPVPVLHIMGSNPFIQRPCLRNPTRGGFSLLACRHTLGISSEDRLDNSGSSSLSRGPESKSCAIDSPPITSNTGTDAIVAQRCGLLRPMEMTSRNSHMFDAVSVLRLYVAKRTRRRAGR
jgi:hypothetical protein